jgi:glycosidase
MAGGAGLDGDPALRTPMSWTADARGFTSGAPFRALSANVGARNAAAEVGVPGSLHSFYKELIALRRAHPALAEGGYLDPQASGATLAFGREQGGAHALVVLNYGATAAAPAVRNLPAGTTLLARYPPGAGDLTVDGAGQVTVPLPATSFAVFTY